MKITRACDYAMRTLIYMANNPQSDSYMRSELSKLCNVPDSFLGKIMQLLAKAGLLESERGKKGGFRLVKPLTDITMYDIVYAVEGDICITDCIADEGYCDRTDECNVHIVWLELQNDIIKKLKSKTLADIV